jgi:hypothetical protein
MLYISDSPIRNRLQSTFFRFPPFDGLPCTIQRRNQQANVGTKSDITLYTPSILLRGLWALQYCGADSEGHSNILRLLYVQDLLNLIILASLGIYSSSIRH